MKQMPLAGCATIEDALDLNIVNLEDVSREGST